MMSILLRLLLVVCLPIGACLAAPAAQAHEIRPAFLEIREVEKETYDLLWKTPAQGDMRLALNVELPASCTNVSDPRATPVEAAVIQRWRTKCAGGLVGKSIGIENLSQSLTDVIVDFEPLDEGRKTLRVTPVSPRLDLPARQNWTAIAGTYFVLGVQHILSGFDHLMFVLALLLLVGDLRRLLAAVTAFTVAHSITLATTTLGIIKIPSAPVEATIALSIMFVAAELLRSRDGKATLAARLPWIASFTFGLLHGFGFAGALREVGIPEDGVAPALLFFNLGVEAGQVMFIAAVLAAFSLWRRIRLPIPPWAVRVPAYAIGATASFWFVERTMAIF